MLYTNWYREFTRKPSQFILSTYCTPSSVLHTRETVKQKTSRLPPRRSESREQITSSNTWQAIRQGQARRLRKHCNCLLSWVWNSEGFLEETMVELNPKGWESARRMIGCWESLSDRGSRMSDCAKALHRTGLVAGWGKSGQVQTGSRGVSLALGVWSQRIGKEVRDIRQGRGLNSLQNTIKSNWRFLSQRNSVITFTICSLGGSPRSHCSIWWL